MYLKEMYKKKKDMYNIYPAEWQWRSVFETRVGSSAARA